jgi:hypothetical protein
VDPIFKDLIKVAMENATLWENMQTLEQSASTIEENNKAFVSAALRCNINNFTSTQLNTMQNSQWKSLNDAIWNAMFSTPPYVIALVIQVIRRSLIIIIIIGPGDMSTIMPLWRQRWILT